MIICHFHARASTRRKAWLHLRMSRILFAAEHSWMKLHISRSLFCWQLFASHVVGSWSMKMKKTLHQMIIMYNELLPFFLSSASSHLLSDTLDVTSTVLALRTLGTFDFEGEIQSKHKPLLNDDPWGSDKHLKLVNIIRAIFVCSLKMVSVSVRYLFYHPMVEKNKTWTLRFPAKENPNMEKALFDWPIVLQYDVKAISRKFSGHEVFSAERSLNQPKARCVCICSINQSNRSIFVLLLFLFCLRVFISRSYENRSMYMNSVSQR